MWIGFCRNGAFVKALQHCIDQDGFSRSDVAGNKKEAFVVYGGIFQNRKDVLVTLAKPDKLWIHVHLKRQLFLTVVFTVHSFRLCEPFCIGPDN